MKITIASGPLSGKMLMPPSKSYSHRALICAALGGGRAVNVGDSDDCRATESCLEALKIGAPMDANESGSTLRFMVPLALALNGRVEIKGSPRLMERPLTDYFKIFGEQGISYALNDATLTAEGRLKSGDYTLSGDVSSQFLTGLLFALPLLSGDSRITLTTPLQSEGYVNMTLAVLREFGVSAEKTADGYFIKGNQSYKPAVYTVEGDFSQAGFFLAMGSVTCLGLNHASIQGDRATVDVYRRMGMKIDSVSGGYKSDGTARLPIEADVSQIPDFVPVLAAVMATVKGESRIYNAGRLRLKESDRLSAVAEELGRLGADVTEGADYLVIRGGRPLRGAVCSAHNDHRIAMALAALSPHVEGELTIDGAECVKKSLPDFWDRFVRLGGRIK